MTSQSQHSISRNATAVAVSGGADSLYALVVLKEKGEPVFALHARLLPDYLLPPGYADMIDRLQTVCETLGAPLHIANCADAFEKNVIAPFVRAYAVGLTPNPCAHCNTAIKFGLLAETARALGASRLVTGHYARLAHTPEGTALFAGADASKDQSYFLSLVPKERLSFASFPLAEKTKTAILADLESRGLAIPSPGESQEICFVPNDDYRSFIRAQATRIGENLPGPGPVKLMDGTKIGEHKGLWQYTEGQRKGLGIAWKEPLYVVRKDTRSNTLVADGASMLAGESIHVADPNFLVPFEFWPETVLLRTRFRQKARSATAFRDGTNIILREESPSGPHAKGQIAAVYTRATYEGRETLRLLGGGVMAQEKRPASQTHI